MLTDRRTALPLTLALLFTTVDVDAPEILLNVVAHLGPALEGGSLPA